MLRVKSYSGRSRAHLAVYPLSEVCSKQAGGRRSVNPFTMSHNGSPYDLIRVIHVATYARIPRVAIITSFQPPLQPGSAVNSFTDQCEFVAMKTLSGLRWVDFVAIPVFFLDRYSTLQSGSSTQDHRLIKNEIWTTFYKIQNKAAVWFWQWYNLANIQFQFPM